MFGESEWKVKKHGNEKHRTWRKLHLAVDVDTHKVISAKVSLVNVEGIEVLPTLLNPLRRKFHAVW
ncbi:transposase [uncultured Vibrio sp.]|uniref:transposase n=1 Tax=uncultured Vibrio sp. TaxID=114054 RepID=UPI002600EFDB|nr:transposase [uncultured Vibrio sp.]